MDTISFILINCKKNNRTYSESRTYTANMCNKNSGTVDLIEVAFLIKEQTNMRL